MLSKVMHKKNSLHLEIWIHSHLYILLLTILLLWCGFYEKRCVYLALADLELAM